MVEESLWPESLEATEGFVYPRLLASGKELSEKTLGKLYTHIKREVFDGYIFYTYNIRMSGRDNYSFELFGISSQSGDFPANIKWRQSDKRLMARSDEEFKQHLKDIFSHPSTLRIVNLLLREVSETGTAYSEADFDLHKEEVPDPDRFALAGASFQQDGQRYASIDVRGIGGFVSFDQVHRLARQPGEPNSAYLESADGEITLDLKFASTIRCEIKYEESKNLRLAAQRLLLRERGRDGES